MSNQLHHRHVAMTMNLQPVVDALAKHFLRLIEQVNPLFLNGGTRGKKVQKEWYGKQLIAANGQSFGYLYFTVTNRSLMNKDFNLDDNNVHVTELEYSFHLKQSETISMARNFTSASLRFKNTWGEFTPEDCSFQLYGGTDIENAIILKDLVNEVEDQMANFTLDINTLIAQNQLDLVPVRMYRGS